MLYIFFFGTKSPSQILTLTRKKKCKHAAFIPKTSWLEVVSPQERLKHSSCVNKFRSDFLTIERSAMFSNLRARKLIIIFRQSRERDFSQCELYRHSHLMDILVWDWATKSLCRMLNSKPLIRQREMVQHQIYFHSSALCGWLIWGFSWNFSSDTQQFAPSNFFLSLFFAGYWMKKMQKLLILQGFCSWLHYIPPQMNNERMPFVETWNYAIWRL